MKNLNGSIKQAYGRTGIELADCAEAQAIHALTNKKLVSPEMVASLKTLGFGITVQVNVPTFEGVTIETVKPTA